MNMFENYDYAEPEYRIEIPQGSIEENEDPIDAAQRELYEETSIRCNRNDLILFQVTEKKKESSLKPQHWNNK
jgi:8-oxo-dGTP pyrophosphatase MutT (NUDIX family)